MSRARARRHLEVVAVDGEPTEEEISAVADALAALVEEEHRNRSLSTWRRIGRAQGRRLGNTDYRDRFTADDAWRLSARLPFGGREFQGRGGRGDSK